MSCPTQRFTITADLHDDGPRSVVIAFTQESVDRTLEQWAKVGVPATDVKVTVEDITEATGLLPAH